MAAKAGWTPRKGWNMVTEKTYTLLNGDEVMVLHEDDGQPADVYTYRDSRRSTIKGLGETVQRLNPLFLHAVNVAEAWRFVQDQAITLDIEN